MKEYLKFMRITSFSGSSVGKPKSQHSLLSLLRFYFKAYRRKYFLRTRTKLFSFGVIDLPLNELNEIARRNIFYKSRTRAQYELAHWHFRQSTPSDYRCALLWSQRAYRKSRDRDLRRKAAVLQLICHYLLKESSSGLDLYSKLTKRNDIDDDILLARANLEKSEFKRIDWINNVLKRNHIDPITLNGLKGSSFYDRLECGIEIPKTIDGPKVTVLIAAYDASTVLPTALKSLQNQSWANLEIIVLDDFSPTLDTIRIAEKFAAEDTRIQGVRLPTNCGAYVARNHGLDMASGDFVTLHDADDWSHPRKIEAQVRFMLSNQNVIACTSQQARCTNELIFSKLRQKGGIISANTSSLLWRRKQVVQDLGYWDTVRFDADSEFIERIKIIFGRESVVNLSTGPLSFQRNELSSITLDPVIGTDSGADYGARREYKNARNYHHRTSKKLYYHNLIHERPFLAPKIMSTHNSSSSKRKFDVCLIADFCSNRDLNNIIKTIDLYQKREKTVALVERPSHPYLSNGISDSVRRKVCANQVEICVYGEIVECKEVINFSENSSPLKYEPTIVLNK